MALAHHIAPVSATGLRHAFVRLEAAVEGFALTFAKAFHAARAAERAYDNGTLSRKRLESLLG